MKTPWYMIDTEQMARENGFCEAEVRVQDVIRRLCPPPITSTTETYTHKNMDGSTLFIVTLTYTDSTKTQLSSAKRTT